MIELFSLPLLYIYIIHSIFTRGNGKVYENLAILSIKRLDKNKDGV